MRPASRVLQSPPMRIRSPAGPKRVLERPRLPLRLAALGLATACLLAFACDQAGHDVARAGARASHAKPQHARLRCDGCNVVLVSIDTLRADHLSTYGYGRTTSPTIDRFAGQSLVFEHAFAQAPNTLPSHMSIFTGLYPSHHGVYGDKARLADSTITLADVLHRAGYTTAAFTGGGYVRKKFNYHTFDRFQVKEYFHLHAAEIEQVDEMLDWIEHRQARKPFFLFWHTYKVHSPYSPEAEYDRFSSADYDGIVDTDPEEQSPVCDEAEKQRQCNWKGEPYYSLLVDRMGPDDVQHVIDKYDGEILGADAMFRMLLEKLEAEGLTNDTVVVFLSDHGESFAERETSGLIGHGVLYEEVLHVPLMIRIPGTPAARIPQVVELIDLMPTVLRVVGLDVPASLDGHDLFDKARQPMGRFPARAELPPRGQEAVRVPGFSLIRTHWNHGSRTQLFDLHQDPQEEQNVAQERQRLAETLTSLLVSATGDEQRKGEEIVLDENLVKELESLGYL